MAGVGCDTVKMKQILQKFSATKDPSISGQQLAQLKSEIGQLTESGKRTMQSRTLSVGYPDELPVTFQWYVSPAGNDNNPGTSQAPFRSIQRAVDAASSGDAVKIEDGKYNGYVILENKDIYLIGNLYCPYAVILDSYGFDPTPVLNISGGSPEIHGMTLMRGTTGINISNAYPYLSHLIIKQNSGQAIDTGGTFYFALYNSLLYNNNAGGGPVVLLEPPTSGYGVAEIRNATITDNKGTHTFSISSGGPAYLYLYNSIIFNWSIEQEIVIYGMAGTASVSYSHLSNWPIYEEDSRIYLDHLIGSDPEFKSIFYSRIPIYDLSDSSPCIDAGDPGSEWNDRFGKGTARCDMGAYGWESRMIAEDSYYTMYDIYGDNILNPFLTDTYSGDFTYEDTQQIEDFTEQYTAVPGTDVFYQFRIDKPVDIEISHCGSGISGNTYIALFDASGNVIAESRDDTESCPQYATLTHLKLTPGSYYVVSKSLSASSGSMKTTIKGFFRGDRLDSPINSGEYHTGFQYSDPQDTNDFTNTDPQNPSNDIYYKLIITKKMDVVISHCDDSSISGTYIQLLDKDGHLIAYNDRSITTYSPSVVDEATILNSNPGAGTLETCKGFVLEPDFHFAADANNSLTLRTNESLCRIENTPEGEGCPSGQQAYLKISGLEAGTYYIVSEGYSQNGLVTTNIQGYEIDYPDDFHYPDPLPTEGNHPSETAPVGMTAGTFNVGATGAATYSIPIAVPTGVNGLQPSLSVTYNSQAGNGIAGWGCSLSGISAITRRPKTIYHDGKAGPVEYEYNEHMDLSLDGQVLIRNGISAGVNTVFYPESDPYTAVVLRGSISDPWFEVITKDGTIYRYGSTLSSKQGSGRTHTWYLDRVTDPYGNYMSYSYSPVNQYIYLTGITYGYNTNITRATSHNVTLEYETRPDITPFYLRTTRGEMNRRLKKITTKTGSEIFREYHFAYSNADQFSRLASVTEKNGSGEALKPVTFQWSTYGSSNDHTVQNLTLYSSINPFKSQIFATADLNGDGISDIIGITPGYDSLSVRGTLSQQFISEKTPDGSYRYISDYPKLLPQSYQFNNWTQQVEQMAFNPLGDGKQYLLAPVYPDNMTGGPKVMFYVYNHENVNGNPSVPQVVPTPYDRNGILDLTASSELPAYATGDIDNDGKEEIIYIEKGARDGYYPAKIGKLEKLDGIHKPVFKSWTDRRLDLPSKPEKIFIADFNGDGMNDLLVFYSGGHTLYFNQGSSKSYFDDNRKETPSYTANKYSALQVGDFNGDGLPDLILNNTDDPDWYFLLNQGNGTFIRGSEPAITLPDMHDHDFTAKDNHRFSCMVLDLDFDGKSDVVITKGIYDQESTWGNFREVKTIWLRSTGSTLTPIVPPVVSSFEDNGNNAFFIAGDFNGDGHSEIANYGHNCFIGGTTGREWRVYQRNGLQPENGLLTSLTDGMGHQTSIGYANFTDPDFYTKGVGGIYPVMDIQPAMMAVKEVTVPDGVGGTSVTTYKYEGLKIHLTGKGLLGLTKTKATNDISGMTVESGIRSWNERYTPKTVYQRTLLGDKIIDSTRIVYALIDKGPNQYFTHPGIQVKKDEYGNMVTIARTYDDNGNITREKTKYGTNDNMYQTTYYSDYVPTVGIWIPHKPQKITMVQKHPDDLDSCVVRTEYTYDGSKNHILSRKDNAHAGDKAVTTLYTYDTWGNALSETVSATGVPTTSRKFEYDRSGRFPVRKSFVPASSAASYIYDTWGNMLTETDETNSADKFTTTHTYDGWGRRTATITHDGHKQTYSTGWGSSLSRKYYTLTQGNGIPWVKTWYDASGRETKTETIGPEGMPISSVKAYDEKGLVKADTTVQGALTTWAGYLYDPQGRKTEESYSNGKNVSYTYGNRIVTTLVNRGEENPETYTRTYDAWGNVKTSSDPADEVSYTYYSNGKPAFITAGQGTTSARFEMEYDGVGNQTALVDPNAGRIEYRYDALGRVIRQKDAKGQIQGTAYDALGRVVADTLGNEITQYTYVPSGNGIYQLQKVQADDKSISYTYDRFGRVVTEKRQMDGESDLHFAFSYDAFDRLKKTTYPEGFEIINDYDAYGNRVKVTAGAQPIWELAGYTGRVTTAILGSNMTSVTTRDEQGLLTGLRTSIGNTDIRHFTYRFNSSSGNLESRTGMVPKTESFEYDHNRLHVVKHDDEEKMKIEYEANGNIKTKTGLGSYDYHPSRVHAVEYVDNTGDLLNWRGQTIEYTAFHKASNIKDTTENDEALELDIIYGPEQQRWKSELKKDGIVIKSTIFAGDYEKITENGITRHLYYISGGDGLAAVYVKQAGEQDKTYYAHTDHLGSIVKLTDNNGNPVFQASYDAWGLQTLSESNTFTFHRGYTGHEHLPEFGLINMNGRMYHPVLGRFLSPDPFVQAPEYSQNFNRYSYCLNNPLVYTDPSGEWIHLLAGALIGGISNWATNGANFTWEGLGYFGVGALTGALSAGVGVGAQTASSGASFWAGFVGNPQGISTILNVGYTSSFFHGAMTGGLSGFTGGFGISFGNSLLKGESLKDAFGGGLTAGLISGLSGALVSGISDGIIASAQGRHFWRGGKIYKGTMADQSTVLGTPVGQRGRRNCLAANVEYIDRSFGGDLSQESVRNWMGGDPDLDLLIDGLIWDKYMLESGHKVIGVDARSVSLGEISRSMNQGARVSVNLRTDNGHSVTIRSIQMKAITKPNGDLLRKRIFYYIADPRNGGQTFRLSSKDISNAYNIFFIYP
jgi:RHS repeat-associated protein